ncbi:cytochrome c oxidase accessory protein CcoG [Caulobacter sp. BK020]|uniref:cytochrome c oxidase accessory protein CcoG n=1 Tax=Caulobacter sp. BK020 TaxID=2512117 RepID=UPI001047AEE1|nr:cytochrome c oxidase accessory protein CcoG [Caulobacter sp. BK020]TCS03935.1 cytochrome c oxidase accessory protein FixG [Caulobacter sp. BK020]
MPTLIDNTRPPMPPNSKGKAQARAAVSAAARAKGRGDARGGLYKPREPIYPKLVHGRWRTIKWALLIATLAIYYVTPWIRWARPGDLPRQAVLVDFTGRRFYFFDIQLWPQEVYIFTGLMIMGALALFLVTALFGRLWCGYTCPQTVWTDLYIVVERLFEGDRNARMRLDGQPLSLDKAWRKSGKHLTWLAIAFGTGGAWIFYFHDAPTLIRTFWTGQAPLTAYVSCALLTATTYGFAGWMREQVCTYMCPWPRIQGAMLDEHSLQVTYLRDRGEPRGAHKKNRDWAGRGDCIDCKQCVVVCPMGIDIRDGSQLECINCGLCVDACDEILGKLGRPIGLIAYDTDAAVARRARGQAAVYKPVRARTLYYALALVLVSGLTLWGLLARPKVDLHVIRDRNPIFVRMHDGAVRDGYTLKISNRTFFDQRFVIAFDGVAGVRLGRPGGAADPGVVLAPADQVVSVRVFVTAPADAALAASTPVRFVIASGAARAEAKTVFLSGAENPQ